MDKATTVERKFKCLECGNQIEVAEGMSVGDYFECEFCGIEYEILEVTESGEYIVSIVEEEK
jgi:DNA-directed RNA polymerase subunit RPC12/RpoP